MGRAALDLVADYYETLAGRAGDPPHHFRRPAPAARRARSAAGDAVSRTAGHGPRRGREFSRHNGHPRFFGTSPRRALRWHAVGSLIAAASQYQRDLLALRPGRRRDGAALHPLAQGDAGLSRGGRGTAGERRLDGELRRLAAARSAKAPVNVVREGMARRAHAHLRLRRGALLHPQGGRACSASARTTCASVADRRRLRMDLADLERLVREDRAAGHLPFCVVASAGTAGTGRDRPDRRDRRRGPRARSLAARGRRLRRIRGPGALGARLLRAHRRRRFRGARSAQVALPAGGLRLRALPRPRGRACRLQRECRVHPRDRPARTTRRSPSGTTARNSRVRSARSICGCC